MTQDEWNKILAKAQYTDGPVWLVYSDWLEENGLTTPMTPETARAMGRFCTWLDGVGKTPRELLYTPPLYAWYAPNYATRERTGVSDQHRVPYSLLLLMERGRSAWTPPEPGLLPPGEVVIPALAKGYDYGSSDDAYGDLFDAWVARLNLLVEYERERRQQGYTPALVAAAAEGEPETWVWQWQEAGQPGWLPRQLFDRLYVVYNPVSVVNDQLRRNSRAVLHSRDQAMAALEEAWMLVEITRRFYS